jgi:CRP-like cAMP-binding protein
MVSPELLRRYPFFAGFADNELKRLAMAGREMGLGQGERLFAEGEAATTFYFLIDGEVEILICASEDCPESVALSSLPAGQLVGWSALVEPSIYTASAQATRPSRVIAFSQADFEPLKADAHLYCRMMYKVAQVIGHRLKDTRVQLISLTTHQA